MHGKNGTDLATSLDRFSEPSKSTPRSFLDFIHALFGPFFRNRDRSQVCVRFYHSKQIVYPPKCSRAACLSSDWMLLTINRGPCLHLPLLLRVAVHSDSLSLLV